MATLKVYKLYFTSPLHIGDKRDDESVSLKTIHSDTLHAALMSCLAKIGVAIPSDGDLGFVISSTFPYYQKEKDSRPVYFMPMPLQSQLSRLSDVSNAKKVKKVKWVDVALYGDVMSGCHLFENSDKFIKHISGEYLTENESCKCDFIKSEVVQRVHIPDRTGKEEAVPYFVDKIFFKDFSGLFFIAVGDTDMLDKGLNILAQEGIGTDRNVGMGFFEYSVDSITLDIPKDATHIMSLSMFIPECKSQLDELLDSDDVAYDFARRGGWITTNPYIGLRKNAVYEFLPSSVFSCLNGKKDDVMCLGKILDLTPCVGELTPKHKIWRNGKAIMLPIKVK